MVRVTNKLAVELNMKGLGGGGGGQCSVYSEVGVLCGIVHDM